MESMKVSVLTLGKPSPEVKCSQMTRQRLRTARRRLRNSCPLQGAQKTHPAHCRALLFGCFTQ